MLKINTQRIKQNIETIQNKLGDHNIKLVLVTKVLNGHKETLHSILEKKLLKNIFAIGDSRISHLKYIKRTFKVPTLLIKPPSLKNIKDIITYCDYCHVSNIKTVQALNSEAKLQNKILKIFVPVEMGDKREGVNPKNLLNRIKELSFFKHLEIVGICSNFGCLIGPHPMLKDLEKMVKLKKEVISFFKNEKLLSACASNSLPLLGNFPKEIDILRLGESIFLGNADENFPIPFLNQNNFEFQAEILNKRGNEYLLDFGNLDVPHEYFKNEEIIGSSSELTVLKSDKEYDKYIPFKILNYNLLKHLMFSNFIRKEVI